MLFCVIVCFAFLGETRSTYVFRSLVQKPQIIRMYIVPRIAEGLKKWKKDLENREKIREKQKKQKKSGSSQKNLQTDD